MKKLMSLLLACVVVITTVLMPTDFSYAASNVKIWNGAIDTSWFNPDDIKESYNIYTAEQLAGLAKLANEAAHGDRFKGITINLMNDIVLNDTSNYDKWLDGSVVPKNIWDPIGAVGNMVTGYKPFAGVFNGNGHTISGMYVDCGEPGGLFCYTSGAVITSLRFEKCYVKSGQTAGVLVGTVEGSFIQGIDVDECYVRTVDDRWAAAGGIAGTAESTNVLPELSYTVLLGMGIVVNPALWFGFETDTIPPGTYFVNCRTVDSRIVCTPKWYANNAGGILGGGNGDFGIYNCYSADCEFTSYSGRTRGNAGGVVGNVMTRGGQVPTHYIKNAYCCNFKRIDGYDGRNDEAEVATVDTNTLRTKTFADKLSDGFKYVSWGYPVVKSVIQKENPFKDVPQSWYTSSILYVCEKGAMTGTGNARFSPKDNLTRGMMATLLYKIEGSPAVKVSSAVFPDVKPGSWYTNAVAWAKANNIVNGYTSGADKGYYRPGNTITRQEFILILYRYANYKKYNTAVKSATGYLAKADANAVSSYAKTAVNWGYEKGFIGNNSNLDPKKPIDRAAAATIIARFLQEYSK